MFETEEKIAFGLLVAVLSIIGAAVIIITYMGTGSFATQYTSTLPDGTLVQFQGHVEKVSLTKAGDHQILTITGVQVFAPTGDTQVNEGDAIAVC